MYLIQQNKRKFLFFIMLFGTIVLRAQTVLQFNSIDSLFKFAETNSATIKNGNQQSLLAKWTKIASVGNTINLKSPFAASWTDNTLLPVSYLPAEAFGGPTGALKEVSLGQQFVSAYNISPQIDIINPSAWARVKSATLNEQLTEANNLIAKKNLFESISASYHNIISLQQQINYLEQSATAADTILAVAKNKFYQGIIREQDMNNANINLLNIQDKLIQAKLALDQNYNNLKILCDVKPERSLKIIGSINSNSSTIVKPVASSLIEKQSQLQRAYLKSELNATRLASFSPTVSLIFNQTWQQNSNVGLLDANANKFTSQYFGVKLTVPFPLDVNRMSTNYTSKINYKISEINYAHSTLQNQLNNQQLDLEYQKANSTYTTAKRVSELKEMNYVKSVNQYNEGIISTDILLTAFTDKINAQLNYSAAFAVLKFAESKINLNNTIK
ncbi:MAG: TolC family protein [Bacteroidota bacterium]|nr:TolC family protein [Bacteroidota bacterium]